MFASAAAGARQKGSAGSMLKHLTDTLIRLGRTLEVLVSRDLLADLLTLQGKLLASIRSYELGDLITSQAFSEIGVGLISWAYNYLLRRDGLLASLSELLDGLLIVSQILLAADKDDRKTLAEMQDLGDPLQEHVSARLYQ